MIQIKKAVPKENSPLGQPYDQQIEYRNKPGYVSSGHLSRAYVAIRLNQATRKLTSSHMFPVWSFFEWGL